MNRKGNHMKNTRVQEFLQKLLVVLIVIVMSFIDIAPLFGLAEELDVKGVNEENVTSDEQEDEEDNIVEADEEEDVETEILDDEYDDANDEKHEDDPTYETTDEKESEIEEGNEISDDKDVQTHYENGQSEEKKDEGIGKGQTRNKYVLAKDSDFSGSIFGGFRYIGTDDYVE